MKNQVDPANQGNPYSQAINVDLAVMLKLKKGENLIQPNKPTHINGSQSYMQQTTTSSIKKNINSYWRRDDSRDPRELRNAQVSKSMSKY